MLDTLPLANLKQLEKSKDTLCIRIGLKQSLQKAKKFGSTTGG